MGVEDVVREGYNRLAPTYVAWADAVEPPLRQEYLERLEGSLGPASRVLEIGCGPGVPVALWLSSRCRVVGVDVSDEMVRLATGAVPNAEFLRADISQVSFDDESFDAVVAFYSLIHVPREKHADVFRSVFRWLRPGGWFVASLGAHDWEGEEQDWLGAGRMSWSFFGEAVNRQLLAGAGFEVEYAEVRRQVEPGDEAVEFLWVVARRPALASA